MCSKSFISTLFFLVIYSFSSYAQSIEPGIKLSIHNLRNNNGHVLVSLFKEGKGYPDEPEKAYRIEKTSITNRSATVTLSGLQSGEYAIAILHDENDDQKMNTNFLGLPKEGYGFSNNVMGLFGPPSFSKASFAYSIKEVKKITIRTRY